MGFFDFFRTAQPKSAAVAKERLQIIITHEHVKRRRSPDYLPALKRELLDVIRKYVSIDQDQVKVHVDKKGEREVLELNIILPGADAAPPAG